jgi:hypothetical protein
MLKQVIDAFFGMLTTVETVPTVVKGIAYIESPGKMQCLRMLCSNVVSDE